MRHDLNRRFEAAVRAPALALLVSLVASGAMAQTTTATISGVVKDTSGAVLPGATITVKSAETGAARTVVTDAAGHYSVLSLDVGSYDARAELEGFQTQVMGGITLTVGRDVHVNFTLELGTIATELTVSAEAPLVDTSTVNSSGLVGEREIKDLPLNGRSYDQLITLNPGTVNYTSTRGGAGVTGSSNLFAVSGRRPQENQFLMNGIPLTGASAQNNLPGGVSGQLLGIDAVREFTVQKDTYSAEFGGRAGGQINVVTMSGSNEFHGSVFEFHRNSAFDARNFFDLSEAPPFRRNNFGASAGGPIRSGATFFFANYEGLRQRLGLSSLAIVPDENARRGLLPDPANPGALRNLGLAPGVADYFQFWPLPNGRNLGDGTGEHFSNPKQTINENFLTVRVDHTFTPGQTLSVTYMIDDGDNFTPAPNPYTATAYDLRMQVATGQLMQILSERMVNTIKFGYTNAAWHFSTQPTIDYPKGLAFVDGSEIGIISIGGGGAGGSTAAVSLAGAATTGQDQVTYKHLYSYQDGLQITTGRHLFGLGFSALNVQTDQDTTTPKNGSLSFNGLTEFLQGRAFRFDAVLKHQESNFRQWQFAWYVQDTIKLGDRVTANVGLRHEIWNGWNEASGRASNYVVRDPSETLPDQPRVGTSPFVENNGRWLFGPRAGLVWDPTGSGRTAVRGGVGIYYSLQDELGLGIQKNPPFTTRIQVPNPPFPIHLTREAQVAEALVSPSTLDPYLHMPRVHRYGVSLQRQIGRGVAVAVGYVGSRGYNEAISAETNNTAFTVCSAASRNCPAGLPDGTKYFLDATGRANPRKNPRLGSASQPWFYIGHSEYNALELEVTGRPANGFSFRGNYTLSKSQDIASTWIANDGLNDTRGVLDPTDIELDYGPSSYDTRHRLSFNATYEVPEWSGGGLAGAILGRWQVNAILNLQSGLVFTPRTGFSRSSDGTGGASDRPNLAPGADPHDAVLGKPEQWFDPTIFTLPPNGTLGNAGRNILIGPDLATVDVSIFRMIGVASGMRVQLRGEVFNVFNRANFGLPSNIVFNSNGTQRGAAGRIANTATTSRQAQLGLKIIW